MTLKVTGEIQVKELFFKYAEQLGFKILESRNEFPDYLIQGRSGLVYQAEVEHRLSNFIRHEHNWREVDFIIYWIDDLHTVPHSYIDKFGDNPWFGALLDLRGELAKLRAKVTSK